MKLSGILAPRSGFDHEIGGTNSVLLVFLKLTENRLVGAACGIAYEIFNEIGENPLISACHKAGEAARKANADFILGIGGRDVTIKMLSKCVDTIIAKTDSRNDIYWPGENTELWNTWKGGEA